MKKIDKENNKVYHFDNAEVVAKKQEKFNPLGIFDGNYFLGRKLLKARDGRFYTVEVCVHKTKFCQFLEEEAAKRQAEFWDISPEDYEKYFDEQLEKC